MPDRKVNRERIATGAPQRGFTLIEVLLVLALMVVIAALVAPAVRGPLDNARLRAASDAVRAEMAIARNRAMRTGEVHLFRYQIGTSEFSVEAWREIEVVADDAPLAVDDAPADPSASMLPDGITFLDGLSERDSRTARIQADLQATETTDASTSRTIVFYPDGTASTAWVLLRNERDRVLGLRLRGLTGMVRTDGVTSLEEALTP